MSLASACFIALGRRTWAAASIPAGASLGYGSARRCREPPRGARGWRAAPLTSAGRERRSRVFRWPRGCG
eukprot:8064383-Alexandrium_andersonii.AAC.1